MDPETTKMAVGDLVHEDIGSVILEYDHHNVIADFTSWEPTYWCEDWGIDLYGTNGVFHGIVNPPKGELLLRAARGGFPEDVTKMPTANPAGARNEKDYYRRQVDLFLKRCAEGAKTEMCDMAEEVKIMKVLEGIYRSASERRFVDIAE